MDKSTYGLPNAFPEGMIEPIAQMDLVMAKINYDGHKPYNGIDRQMNNNNKES